MGSLFFPVSPGFLCHQPVLCPVQAHNLSLLLRALQKAEQWMYTVIYDFSYFSPDIVLNVLFYCLTTIIMLHEKSQRYLPLLYKLCKITRLLVI
ncbi:MAG TPA: hypothetical protein ENJ08_15530 [Gammaproteobacteria bacterium]|nr:hypothetical protein [Gammaproteobacteria bacterium]